MREREREGEEERGRGGGRERGEGWRKREGRGEGGGESSLVLRPCKKRNKISYVTFYKWHLQYKTEKEKSNLQPFRPLTVVGCRVSSSRLRTGVVSESGSSSVGDRAPCWTR